MFMNKIRHLIPAFAIALLLSGCSEKITGAVNEGNNTRPNTSDIATNVSSKTENGAVGETKAVGETSPATIKSDRGRGLSDVSTQQDHRVKE